MSFLMKFLDGRTRNSAERIKIFYVFLRYLMLDLHPPVANDSEV